MEQDFNQSLDAATAKLNAINTAINKITASMGQASGAARTFSTAIRPAGSGIGVGGTRQALGTDGASFGAGGGGGQAMAGVSGVIGGLGTAVGGVAKAMPGTQNVIDYSRGYYGASLYSGGANRKLMQQATFSGMSQGMTSVGADARVAAQLTGAGMNFSNVAGSTYMQTVQTAGNISRYLNMDVEKSAAAVEGLTNAGGASNLLQRFGIFTSDLATGKEKTMTQIFGELRSRLALGDTTVEGTMDSLRKGALGETIRQSGLSQDQQALFSQYMLDSAAGKSTDWLNDKTLGSDNPLSSTYALNASETKQYGKAEDSYIQGIKDMVPTISALNDAFGDLASQVGNVKTAFETFTGSNAGSGVVDVAKGLGQMFGGFFNLGTALKGVGGSKYGASSMNSVSTGGGIGGALSGTGGDSSSSAQSGGNSVGKSSQSFTSPTKAARVTARLGQKGQYWDKEVGHRGTDFAAAQGTPILSIGDGVVESTKSGGELGNQIYIRHTNGFVSHYCHLSTMRVTKGAVTKGQEIAAAGNTGTNSHGAHLHFVLYSPGGGSVDPFNYIPGLSDASGAGDNKGSGASSYSGSGESGDTASAEGTSSGGYIGASSLISGSMSGISAGDNSASAALGASPTASSNTPEAINGSTFGGKSSGSGTGYKTNAKSAKTGTDNVAQDGTYNLHQGESVRTAAETKAYREGKANGGGKGANVTINVTVAQASEAEARRMVTLMKTLIEEDNHIAKIGRS